MPFIVGTTLRRDHIFWPRQTETDKTAIIALGDLLEPYKTAQRALISWEQIMALTWRIREWHFSGAWSASASGAPGSVSVSSTVNNSPTPNSAVVKTAYPEEDDTITNFPVLHDVLAEPLLASEFLMAPQSPPPNPQYSTDLRFPRRHYGFISPVRTAGGVGPFGFLNMTQVPGGAATSATIFMFGDRRKQGAFVLPSGVSRGIDIVTYTPPAITFGPLIVFTDGATMTVPFECRTPIGVEVPNVTMTIDPVVAPAFTIPLIISVSAPATLTSAVSTLTMTANAFYQYQNSLGQNVYNATTGAEENDPFA